MIDLSSKHVFITGGSRGIGAACARLAAGAGADVSLTCVARPDAAESVAADVRALGRRAFVAQADARDEAATDRAVDAAVAELGPLSGMVVSAGIFEAQPLGEMTLEFWNRVLGINLTGTFLAVRAAARHMRAAGEGGSVVVITSTAGQRGSAVYSAYATSKGGQILFMRSMAQELGPDRIRVNCVAPSWTETDMAAASLDAIGRDNAARGFALGRIGLPDDVAGAALYLLSDLAAFVTGVTLTVDGGSDMRG